MRRIMCVLSLVMLTGCAIGAGAAATSGYALKAKTAEALSPSGEQRIVDRAREEMMMELQAKGILKP